MRWLVLAMMAPCASSAPPPEGLASDVAQREVEAQRESLEGCNQTGEAVRLEVRIVVAPDGDVEDARARGSAAVGPCVEREIRRWEFPSAPGRTEIEVPLEFTPTEPDDDDDEPDSDDGEG